MNITITPEQFKKLDLMVCMPCYGGLIQGVCAQSLMELQGLCAQYGVKFRIQFLMSESLISRARTYLTDAFMRSPCTHMLFVDADIQFSAKDILTMIGIQISNEGDNNYDIVSAPYSKKCISYEKIKQAVDMGVADNDPGILKEYVGDFVFNVAGVSQQRPMTLADLQEPMEVSEAGTGMMLIRRKTLEQWEKGHEDRLYYPDHARTADFNGHRQIYQYFAVNLVQTDPNNPQSKRLLSEDYLFCWEVRQLGMHVWMCPWMRLGHVGTMTYGGSLIEMAKIGASMTVDPARIKDGYVQKPATLSSGYGEES